jgi:hypothetical protein
VTTHQAELVRRAIKQRAGDLRESKRGLGDAYDEYWCVFDVDTHPHLNEALQLARSEDIRVALSNPCIELWIIIHFQDQTAYLSAEVAVEKAAVLLGCGKTPTPTALERLVERYNDAKERARQLDKKHDNDGSRAKLQPKHWCLAPSGHHKGRPEIRGDHVSSDWR